MAEEQKLVQARRDPNVVSSASTTWMEYSIPNAALQNLYSFFSIDTRGKYKSLRSETDLKISYFAHWLPMALQIARRLLRVIR